MTKEEKAELERGKANAKGRCREVYATIQQLQSILSTYYKDYYRWRERFKKADQALAEEEKLTKVPSPGGRRKEKEEKGPDAPLTKKQIMAIIEELGVKVDVKIELNFDEEGGETDE